MRHTLKTALLAVTFPLWGLPYAFWLVAEQVQKDIEARKVRTCPTRRP